MTLPDVPHLKFIGTAATSAIVKRDVERLEEKVREYHTEGREAQAKNEFRLSGLEARMNKSGK